MHTNNLMLPTITEAINNAIADSNNQITLVQHFNHHSDQDGSYHNSWVLELKPNCPDNAIEALQVLETTLPRKIAQLTNSPLLTSPSPDNYLIPNYEPDCFIPYLIFNTCFCFTLQETDCNLYITLTEYEY